jgi:hypothetical protein
MLELQVLLGRGTIDIPAPGVLCYPRLSDLELSMGKAPQNHEKVSLSSSPQMTERVKSSVGGPVK